MSLFHKTKHTPELPHFDPENFEPVIRASICTGERVGCMREKTTGKLHELMLIRTDGDLERFCNSFGLDREKVKTVY